MIYYFNLFDFIFVASRGNGRSRGRGSRGRGSRGRRSRSRDGHQPEVSRLQLTHVEVAFLTPNTTSHLQPLDAGIIANFKSHYKRNYCRHVLELFEEGKDINKEKINIKESIDYVSDAWTHVTEETIQNCWKKTGILPSSTNEDIDNAAQTQQETMDREAADIDQMIGELNISDPYATLLTNALNDFFKDLEEEIPTEAILNEDDIIKLVQKEMDENDKNDEDDSEEEPTPIPLKDAIKSLQNWITFFEQQQIDEFRVEDMNVFKKYLILAQQIERQSRKQVSITNFFNI